MLDRIELQRSVTHKESGKSSLLGGSAPDWYWRQPLLEALPGGELRDRRGEAFGLRAGLFVQSFGEFLQAGNDLGRLGQDRGGELFRIIRTPLRHFRERHHYCQSVVYRMLDFAVFSLELFQLCIRNGLFTHSPSI